MKVAVFRNHADSYLPNKIRMSYLESEARILQYQYIVIRVHSKIVCSKGGKLTVSPRSAHGQPKASPRSEKIRKLISVLYVRVTAHRKKKFFIIKPTRRTYFANLFLAWNSTCFGQLLCSSSGIHSLYTQQWYRSYSRTRMELQFHSGPARKLSTNLYDLYRCWV